MKSIAFIVKNENLTTKSICLPRIVISSFVKFKSMKKRI